MDTASVVVPAIFIGGILLMLPIAYRVLRRHNDRMRRMADELGFTFHGAGDEPPGAAEPTGVRRFLQIFKPWRMTGMHDGVAVAIYLESRGTSRNRTSYSIVEASFPRPLPFTLLVGRETAMARLGKAVFGIQDIQVGSEQFDAAVRVKGSEPDRIRRILLSTGVQDRILAALEASPTVAVTEKAARWEKRGTVEKAETYQQAMDLVVPIVRALKDAAAFGPD